MENTNLVKIYRQLDFDLAKTAQPALQHKRKQAHTVYPVRFQPCNRKGAADKSQGTH